MSGTRYYVAEATSSHPQEATSLPSFFIPKYLRMSLVDSTSLMILMHHSTLFHPFLVKAKMLPTSPQRCLRKHGSNTLNSLLTSHTRAAEQSRSQLVFLGGTGRQIRRGISDRRAARRSRPTDNGGRTSGLSPRPKRIDMTTITKSSRPKSDRSRSALLGDTSGGMFR